MRATDEFGSPPEVLRTDRLGCFRLRETLYRGDTRVPAHDHVQFNLCLTLVGRCVERRAGTSLAYVGPALTLNLPSSGHEIRIDSGGVRCFSLSGPADWLSTYSEAAGGRVDPVINTCHPPLVSRALRLVEEHRRPGGGSEAEVEHLLVEILDTSAGIAPRTTGGAPPAWLADARDILHQETPRAPALSALAHRVGVHRVHLARCFRRYFGTTVGAYARDLQLREAEREIARGERSLGEIALRTGFYDQSHFHRFFRRATGMTPGRFRALVRGG